MSLLCHTPPPTHTHLKDLLAGDLDATVACLGLLQGQLVAQQLQLVHQVPLVAHRHLPVTATHAASTYTTAASTSTLLTPHHLHLGGLGRLLGLRVLAARPTEDKKASDESAWVVSACLCVCVSLCAYLIMVCNRGSVNCVVRLLWSTK